MSRLVFDECVVVDNGPEPNDVTSLQGNKETCALEDFKHSKQPLTNAKGSLVLLHKFYTWYKSQTECFFFFLNTITIVLTYSVNNFAKSDVL